MQDNIVLVKNLKEKFFSHKTREFNVCMPQKILDVEAKSRSNFFSWRGQFSPQLIENLLLFYCPKNATILDLFSGSGTVLYEAGCLGIQAFGCDINPAAWILSRTYELINIKLPKRQEFIESLKDKLESAFPQPNIFEDVLSSTEIDISEFEQRIYRIRQISNTLEQIILDSLIILLDLGKQKLTFYRLYSTFFNLCQLVKSLPESEAPIMTSLGDARCLSLETNSIDFIVTSPPYINVFNYHQNYRRSAEVLGWDLLKIAKSEIGSNRANRSNRFLTVIQYCLDMAFVLKEIQRVCKPLSRIIFVVGYESNVLEVPFYNSKIISKLSEMSGCFEFVLTQKRYFKNKFGKEIREDLIHLVNRDFCLPASEWDEIARNISDEILKDSLNIVTNKNKPALIKAIERVFDLEMSPL